MEAWEFFGRPHAGGKRKAEQGLDAAPVAKEQKTEIFTRDAAKDTNFTSVNCGVGFSIPLARFTEVYNAIPAPTADTVIHFEAKGDVITLRGTITLARCACNANGVALQAHHTIARYLDDHLVVGDLRATCSYTNRALRLQQVVCTIGRDGLNAESERTDGTDNGANVDVPTKMCTYYTSLRDEMWFKFRCRVAGVTARPSLDTTAAEQWALMESGAEGDITFKTLDGTFKVWRAVTQPGLPFLGLYAATKAGATADGVIEVPATTAATKLIAKTAVTSAVPDLCEMKLAQDLDPLMTAARQLMFGPQGPSRAYFILATAVTRRIVKIVETVPDALDAYAFAKKFKLGGLRRELERRVANKPPARARPAKRNTSDSDEE